MTHPREGLARLGDEEQARRSRLPDLRGRTFDRSRWDGLTREAGLGVVFDVDGRAASPSDDDLHDAVERAMRDDGRDEGARAFAGTRPPRASGDPPRAAFDAEPDPLRRGPPDASFELRATSRGEIAGVRARCERGGPEAWAALDVTPSGELRFAGAWREVPPQRFGRLLEALDAVLGRAAPRATPPPLVLVHRAAREGGCACCGRPIRALGLAIRLVPERESTPVAEVRLDLICAIAIEPAGLEAAIQFHGLGLDDLKHALTVVRAGPATRCSACRGIVRKGEPRLESPLVDWKLHFACALANEPDGLGEALARSEPFETKDEWEAKLSASSGGARRA